MGFLAAQLRQVLRRLGRAPFFTVVTLLTLAVGIGANTAIFSVLEGVLLKPLPYPHPEELVAVWLTAPGINIKDLNHLPQPTSFFASRPPRSRISASLRATRLNVTGLGAGRGRAAVRPRGETAPGKATATPLRRTAR